MNHRPEFTYADLVRMYNRVTAAQKQDAGRSWAAGFAAGGVWSDETETDGDGGNVVEGVPPQEDNGGSSHLKSDTPLPATEPLRADGSAYGVFRMTGHWPLPGWLGQLAWTRSQRVTPDMLTDRAPRAGRAGATSVSRPQMGLPGPAAGESR